MCSAEEADALPTPGPSSRSRAAVMRRKLTSAAAASLVVVCLSGWYMCCSGAGRAGDAGVRLR